MKHLFTPLLCLQLFYFECVWAAPALEEVVITASRVERPLREVGASVSVISAEEIQLRGYQNITDVLRTAAGVAVSRSGGEGKATAVRIRGEESFRTLIMVDGIDISDPAGTQVMPSPQHLGGTGNIERVEILRGPQGFVYGADAGGVINIITRKVAGFAAEVSAQRGAYQSLQLQGFIATGSSEADLFVSVSDSHTDGFNARISDTGADDDGYENTTVHAKAGWNPNSDLRIQALVRHTDAMNAYDNCGLPRVNACTGLFAQRAAKMDVNYAGANTQQHFSISHISSDREYYAADEAGFMPEGTVKKTEYVGSFRFSPLLNLTWGGDYETQHVRTNYGVDDSRNQTGLFTELQSDIGRSFYFSVGARLDQNSDFGEHTSVRVSPAYIHAYGDARVKYRGSYGTGFRAPSLGEIAFNRGVAAELTEESSEGADIGVDVFYASGASLSLGYFDQSIENEIYYNFETNSYSTAEGVSHSRGAEFSFEAPLGPHFSLTGNYTYNRTLTEADSPRVRRPKHLANLSLNAAFLSQHLNLLVNARGVKDTKGLNGDNLPNYALMDASGAWQFTAALQVFMRIENVLNKHYVEVSDFNTSKRAVYGGVKYTF